MTGTTFCSQALSPFSKVTVLGTNVMAVTCKHCISSTRFDVDEATVIRLGDSDVAHAALTASPRVLNRRLTNLEEDAWRCIFNTQDLALVIDVISRARR